LTLISGGPSDGHLSAVGTQVSAAAVGAGLKILVKFAKRALISVAINEASQAIGLDAKVDQLFNYALMFKEKVTDSFWTKVRNLTPIEGRVLENLPIQRVGNGYYLVRREIQMAFSSFH
jgi:hypothetical protein